MNKFSSPFFKEINEELDLMEIERLSLGLWRMYAQMLLPRADPDFARELLTRLIEATKEAAKDKELTNQTHVQDALIQFEHEVRRSISDSQTL